MTTYQKAAIVGLWRQGNSPTTIIEVMWLHFVGITEKKIEWVIKNYKKQKLDKDLNQI